MRNYQLISGLRNLNVIIFLDDNEVFRGNVDDCPSDLKNMYYSKIDIKQSMPIELYIYTNMNS